MRARTVTAIAATGSVALAATGATIVGAWLSGAGEDAAAPGTAVAASPSSSPTPEAQSVDTEALAADFLADWVDDDGRVVRRDQGGDTVSEGQAYGLLAAVVADDEAAFDRIWDWTRAELVRADGLLAWQWDQGEVVDAEPAADADLDAARALVLAGGVFGRDDLGADGVMLGDAVLDHLTVDTSLGLAVAPGLWAVDREPLPYNPSYASPATYAVLERASGDPRWGELAAGASSVTSVVLEATDLPPNWAQITGDGSVDSLATATGGDGVVEYGYDAARTIVRFAESCTADDTALSAQVLPALSYQDVPPARLDLGGGALTENASALSYAARAAAHAAHGDRDSATDDLVGAAELAASEPTYYGAAWAMLGAAMLTDPVLGGCPPLESDS